MNCIRCGAQTAGGALFCETCKKTVGEPLQESAYLNTQILLPVRKAQPQQTKPVKKAERKPEEEKPRGRGAIAALTVLCLLLLAGALFLGTRWLAGREDNAALTAQVESLENEKTALEDESAAQAERIAALETQTAALEDRTAAQEASAAAQEDAYAALEKRASALEKDKTELLETLAFFNENVAFLPNDGTYLYHAGDCSKLDKTNFLVFSVSTAKSWGYKPCPDCQPAE